MAKTLQCAIFRYAPIGSEYSINLGVLFHEEELDYRKFYFSSKCTQLEQFQDHVDISVVEKLLKGMKEEIEDEYRHNFDIQSYIQFYINDFSFSEVQTVVYSKLKEAVTAIYSTYME